MTNSHNRTNSHQAEISGQSSTTNGSGSGSGNTSGRFFANNGGNAGGKYGARSTGGSAKKQQQQHQLNQSLNSSRGSSNSNDKFFVSLKNGMGATSTPGKPSRASPQHHRHSPQTTAPAAAAAVVLAPLSSSPPNLSHFAGSKCYDAPAPTALPKPPRHWTGGPGQPLEDVVMTVPVSTPPQQQKQSYYQKAATPSKTGGHSTAKKQAQHRQHGHQANVSPFHPHNAMMVSCSREYLMAAAATTVNVPASAAAGGSDYDRFSENLKMVLNVRA